MKIRLMIILPLLAILMVRATWAYAPYVQIQYVPVPSSISEDPIERAGKFVQESSEDVSSWAISSMEENYVSLGDVYEYYAKEGAGSQFVAKVRDVLTSFEDVGVVIDRESLEIIYDAWEVISYVKEADLTLSDFDRYLIDDLLDYPTNELGGDDVIPEIIRRTFLPEYSIDLGAFIDVAEEVRSDIERGVPIEDILFRATIQLVEDLQIGDYDPINRVLTVPFGDNLLAKGVFIWDNGIVVIDVADAYLDTCPIEARVTLEPDIEAGCLKIGIDKLMFDAATVPLVGAFLDIELKAGLSADVTLRPDPSTTIDKSIEVSLTGVHAEAGLTAIGIPIAKGELSYYLKEDMVLAMGEAGGQPLWTHYDTSENTWVSMNSYFKQREQHAGYCVTETSHLSMFTIMRSNDPVLGDGWERVLILIVGVIIAVTAVTIAASVLYTRSRKSPHSETSKVF